MKSTEKPVGQRPGDAIINRYMPNATPEEKEAARENLKKLARFILRVEERRFREEHAKGTQCGLP